MRLPKSHSQIKRANADFVALENRVKRLGVHAQTTSLVSTLANRSRQRGLLSYGDFAKVVQARFTGTELTDIEQSAPLKLVLFSLIKYSVDNDFATQIPASIEPLYDDYFVKIIDNIGNDSYVYRVNSDRYKKDLAITLGHLIPVGAELLSPYSGVPRSLAFRGDVKQLLKFIKYFVIRARGFKYYAELHLDSNNLGEFNPKGWARTCVRIADLLEMNSSIKGFFGTAWFYDPGISGISPHLTYLRAMRENGGAEIFCWGQSADALNNALSKSTSRRAAYENGSYLPKSYYIIWHRRQVIRWAERKRHET